MDYFIEKCREVYSGAGDYSESTFIVTNFGLYSVFIELGFLERDAVTRKKHQHFVRLCKDNLEAALANLSILMPATFESIVALTLGVSLSLHLISND